MLNSTPSAPIERSLGISAKSVHKIKPKTDTKSSGMDNKKMRYELQAVAGRLMDNRQGGKQHRVVGCSRNSASDGVVVYRNVTGDNARFSNLMTCGSVWACPVCAAKITEVRRAELQAAINTWVSKFNGSIMLMTLTFPHEADMALTELLDKFKPALQGFKNSRAYKRIFGTPKEPGIAGRAGSVRSLEVTHGANGWHPHTHDLVFVKKSIEHESILVDELRQEWAKQVRKAGLADNSDLNDLLSHGLDIRGGDYAAEYVMKFGTEPKLYHSWSAASEITKQHAKVGGGSESATPFMLLQWAGNGDPYSQAKFIEFVKCFDGKRMNFWSPGLKKLLAIDDIDDEAIAAIDEPEKPEEELVIRLDVDQWKLVLQTGARFEVLAQAAARGLDGVMELLEDLDTREKKYSPYFMTHSRPDVSRFYH